MATCSHGGSYAHRVTALELARSVTALPLRLAVAGARVTLAADALLHRRARSGARAGTPTWSPT